MGEMAIVEDIIIDEMLYDTSGKSNLKLVKHILKCGDLVYSVNIGDYAAPFKTIIEALKFYLDMVNAVSQLEER